MSTTKRIIVTGASRGLGAAMTAGFIELGHTICGCARSKGSVAELSARFGAPHSFDAVDVGDPVAVAAWAKEILAAGPAPDLLINNAALINRQANLWELSAAEFDELIRVNVTGTANVIRHFVPAMIARGSGVIVNFSSGWGRSVSPQVAPYCASKWAIEGLTQALAAELPAGMAAVPLNPGIIDTDMLRDAFGASAGEYPSPETWARAAVPYILKLNSKDNGRPATVPGARE